MLESVGISHSFIGQRKLLRERKVGNIKTTEIKLSRPISRCSRLDKVRKEDTRKELNIDLVKVRMD
jgi:hypothetical protein